MSPYATIRYRSSGVYQFKPSAEAMADVLALHDELRHGTDDPHFSYIVASLTWSEDRSRIIFEGLTGKHTLDAASSSPARVLLHWIGFTSANERRHRERVTAARQTAEAHRRKA